MAIIPTVLLVADTVRAVARAITPQWGIYQFGIPVIASSVAGQLGLSGLVSSLNSLTSLVAGLPGLSGLNVANFSVIEFAFKKDWTVSDYPQEQGAFQSYDKVELPFDVRMRIAAGGSASNLRDLLDRAEAASKTLDLYDVVTPEKTYRSCNITRYDYRRTATNGVGLIVVDFGLVEVRVTATAEFSFTQQPGVAGLKAGGNVQAGVPTADQSALFGRAL